LKEIDLFGKAAKKILTDLEKKEADNKATLSSYLLFMLELQRLGRLADYKVRTREKKNRSIIANARIPTRIR